MSLETLGEEQPLATWVLGLPFAVWSYWTSRETWHQRSFGWWNRPKQPLVCWRFGSQLCNTCPDDVCCDNTNPAVRKKERVRDTATTQEQTVRSVGR
jgi:hypothetical protein